MVRALFHVNGVWEACPPHLQKKKKKTPKFAHSRGTDHQFMPVPTADAKVS